MKTLNFLIFIAINKLKSTGKVTISSQNHFNRSAIWGGNYQKSTYYVLTNASKLVLFFNLLVEKNQKERIFQDNFHKRKTFWLITGQFLN